MPDTQLKRIFYHAALLFVAAAVLASSSCQGFLPEPTARAFPSLTPRPSATQPPTQAPSPTTTSTPAPVEAVRIGTALPIAPSAISAENAANLVLLAAYGKGIPLQMSLSPDGKLAGIAATHGIYLYDTQTLQESNAMETGEIQFSLVFSPDGALVASGSQSGNISIWETSGGALLKTIDLGDLPILRLNFSPDGSQMAATSWDRKIFVIRLDDSQVIYSFSARASRIKELAFSPDGKKLYAWASKESIQVWNLENGRDLPEFYIGNDELGEPPVGIAFSADGNYVAVNHGQRIRIFFTRNGTTYRLLRDIDQTVKDIAISADGSILAAWEGDTVQFWRGEDGARLGSFQLPDANTWLNGLAFLPGNEQILLLDNALHIWQMGEPGILLRSGQMEFASSPEISSGFAESDQQIFTLSADRSLDAVPLNDGGMEHFSYPLKGRSIALHVSNEIPLLAYTRGFDRVDVWPVGGEALMIELELPGNVVSSLAFSPDGKQIACGTDSGAVFFWNIPTGSLGQIINLSETPQSMTFSPDGMTFFARSADMIFQYNLETGDPLRILGGYDMALSGDARILAAATDVNEIHQINIFAVGDGNLVSRAPGFTSSLALSPDGSLLASLWDDLTIWRTADGVLLKTIKIDARGEVRFSPDGSMLVLSAWDGEIFVWGNP